MKMPKTSATSLLLVFIALSMPPFALSNTATVSGRVQRAQGRERFSNALESQITCSQSPDPNSAIRALQRAGIVNRDSYLNYDSISYFNARKPLTVWGLRVVSVFGFDQNPRIFERGQGTAPPLTLGVIVPYSEAKVTAVLAKMGLQNVKVQRAMELEVNPKRRRAPVLTEIYCAETYEQ